MTILHEKKDCYIKQLKFGECIEFLNTYHLQGAGRSTSINLGIFNKDTDELVGLATFGSNRFSRNLDNQNRYEWYRLCYKDDIIVKGGTQRLIKEFEKLVPDVDELVSYQFETFEGTMFEGLGFQHAGSKRSTLFVNPTTGESTFHRFINDHKNTKLQEWLKDNKDNYSNTTDAVSAYFGFTEKHESLLCHKWIKTYHKDAYGYIYLIESPEGKKYVGQKKSKFFVTDYWSSSQNPEYWSDLEKFGRNNFKREILEWCSTLEELNKREIYWIEEKKSMYSEGGYNVCKCVPQIEWTEENRPRRIQAQKDYWAKEESHKKHSESILNSIAYRESRKWVGQLISAGLKRNCNDPEKRAKHYAFTQDPEFKKKIGDGNRGKIRCNNGIKNLTVNSIEEIPTGYVRGFIPDSTGTKRGTKFSDEHKLKLSKSKQGRNWYTDGVKNVLAKSCPDGYKEGRTVIVSERKHWYTNGVNNIKSVECPEGYYLGKTDSREDKNWYTDGVNNILSKECPEGYHAGFTRKNTSVKLNWYTNGIKNIRASECPEGYRKGRYK